MECANLKGCSFIKAYQSDTRLGLALAIQSYIKNYCNGDKESICLRKKIKQQLGADKVPTNMMPSGHPVPNTSINDWHDDVFPVLHDKNIFIKKT